MKATMKSLSIGEAAGIGRKDAFFQNVKREIIPKLIERGKLKGITNKGKLCVLDNAAFRNLMQYGIESFVYNQQGWSFTVIKAPIERVAAILKSRKGVLHYVENVKVGKLGGDAEIDGESHRRHLFLLKTDISDWTVIIQTAHWIQQCDMLIGLLLAAEFSSLLKTLAITAWNDDFSGSTAVVCKNGKKVAELTDEQDWREFYLFFYEQGIFVPGSFISTRAGSARLLVADPSKVGRADSFVIAIPTESQSNSPHLFYKLGMMATAAGVKDEASFHSHVVDSLWKHVQVNLRASK